MVRSKLSAQQELSLARRRSFYVQTITRFEIQFQYPLWESEKEHLSQLLPLRLERPVRNENATRDASLFPQQIQGLAKVTYSDPRSEREVRDDLKRDAAEEKDESEVDDIEDRETEEALKWLGAE